MNLVTVPPIGRILGPPLGAPAAGAELSYSTPSNASSPSLGASATDPFSTAPRPVIVNHRLVQRAVRSGRRGETPPKKELRRASGDF